MLPRPPRSSLFPHPTPFQSNTLEFRKAPYRAQSNAACLPARKMSRPVARANAQKLPPIFPFRRLSKTSLDPPRSEEHTSELQSRLHIVCRLLLENKTLYLYD